MWTSLYTRTERTDERKKKNRAKLQQVIAAYKPRVHAQKIFVRPYFIYEAFEFHRMACSVAGGSLYCQFPVICICTRMRIHSMFNHTYIGRSSNIYVIYLYSTIYDYIQAWSGHGMYIWVFKLLLHRFKLFSNSMAYWSHFSNVYFMTKYRYRLF